VTSAPLEEVVGERRADDDDAGVSRDRGVALMTAPTTMMPASAGIEEWR
jgi:hypothetical protein